MKDSPGRAAERREQDRATRLLVEGTRRLGLESLSGGTPLQRYMLARWVRTRTRVGTRWLAGQMGFESIGTLSYGLWHVGQRMKSDRKIQQRWKLLDSYNPKDSQLVARKTGVYSRSGIVLRHDSPRSQNPADRGKIQIMETIWEDLRERFETSEITHQLRNLLRDRRARVAKGEARLLDWDSVKCAIGRG